MHNLDTILSLEVQALILWLSLIIQNITQGHNTKCTEHSILTRFKELWQSTLIKYTTNYKY